METKDLFYRNIQLFIDNAGRILADPRMAYCPVPVDNGLAQTGSLPPATLGGYVDWWVNSPETSRDRHGRPVWFISGSVLSGRHACLCVDSSGQSVKADLPISVNTIARAFNQSQHKYHPAPTDCTPCTLQAVISLLRADITL